MTVFSLKQAISERRTCRAFEDRAIPADVVERLLWAAQGTTGENGQRTAPSAHALYPLRIVVAAGNLADRAPGIYSVGPDITGITQIKNGDVRQALQDAALEDQPWIGSAAGIITICADFAAAATAFAEQPPYGARGARYVQIEAGAAAQNVQLQAVAEGLGCVLVAGFRDEATADILDLEAPIAPVLHLCFGWPSDA